MMNKEIIAVLDPMCSWCWGFEPVLRRLRKSLPDHVKLSCLMGGLRQSGDQPWNKEFRSYLRGHWSKVEEVSGQPFNMSLLDKKQFDYNTEPSCRAVVALRQLDEGKVFDFVYALQEAFYLRGEDITQRKTIVSILSSFDVDIASFIDLFESDAIREQTKADAYRARSMGANAFPSLVFIDEEGHLCVVKGYHSFEKLQTYLQ